jgi:agmatinase
VSEDTDDRNWDNAFTGDKPRGTVFSDGMFAGALSFWRQRYSRDLGDVDVAVTGLPLDTATSNRPGARFGPRAVREASAMISWERPWPWEFDPFEVLGVVDYGDCAFDYGRAETIPATITDHIKGILDAGAATLAIGGDHFVTYPVLKAYAERYGRLAFLHFDAHSDTWPSAPGRVTHGTMFHAAATEGLVDPATSVQIGLRTTNDDTLGFNVFDATAVHGEGTDAIAQAAGSILDDRPVYVTFDIDCLDPAFAPGTGTPVCGGLSTHQALEIIRKLRGINVVGMDVVEVAPAYDHAQITSLAAASIAAELLCLYASRHGSVGR